jgi:hypothetical protein
MIYRQKDLGNPGEASFQERVANSLKRHGTIANLDKDLQSLGWELKEIGLFRENLVKSINQAAYFMQTLRSKMGDVH